VRIPLAWLLGCVAAALFLSTGPAWASEPLSDHGVRHPTLQVNAKGEALVTYKRQDGVVRHVLVWGAVDAVRPDAEMGQVQVRFKYDYSGGWGKYRRATYWQTFVNACKPYTGPSLEFFVVGCDAPDGSYWALQSWQRGLPLLGFDPWLPSQTAFELEVSHWTKPLPVLDVYVHRTYSNQYQGLFGRLTWQGVPVYGFGSTSTGVPTDRWGRNVFIDTYDSIYGPGWRRESGILLHRGTGTFCHSFVWQHPFPGYPSQTMRPPAPGERYRVTVMGPGVTPTVTWEGFGIATDWSSELQAQATGIFDRVMSGDRHCARER
jgi:hypothetical protein